MLPLKERNNQLGLKKWTHLMYMNGIKYLIFIIGLIVTIIGIFIIATISYSIIYDPIIKWKPQLINYECFSFEDVDHMNEKYQIISIDTEAQTYVAKKIGTLLPTYLIFRDQSAIQLEEEAIIISCEDQDNDSI